jgi:hypothetical protein
MMREILILIAAILLLTGCSQKISENSAPLVQANVVKNLEGNSRLVNECGSDEFIHDSANTIAFGIVSTVITEWNEEQGLITTVSKVKLETLEKEKINAEELEIRTPGGCVKNYCQKIEDNPALHENAKVKLYLQKTGEGLILVCNMRGIGEWKQ